MLPLNDRKQFLGPLVSESFQIFLDSPTHTSIILSTFLCQNKSELLLFWARGHILFLARKGVRTWNMFAKNVSQSAFTLNIELCRRPVLTNNTSVDGIIWQITFIDCENSFKANILKYISVNREDISITLIRKYSSFSNYSQSQVSYVDWSFAKDCPMLEICLFVTGNPLLIKLGSI